MRAVSGRSLSSAPQSGRVPFAGTASRAAAPAGVSVPAKESLERSTLESGVEVLSVDLPSATTSLSLFVKSGSRFEDRQTAGASSFLKHLAFRNSADKTGLRLVRDLEHVGASMTVSVDREHVAYHVTGLRPSAAHDVSVAVMAETLRAVLQPTLLEYEVNNVRSFVLHDAQSRSAEDTLRDRVHAEAFQNSGLARSPVASASNAASRTPQQLHRFVSERHTSGANLAVVGLGIEHATLTRALTPLLGAKSALQLKAPYYELRALPALPAADSAASASAASVYPKAPVLLREEADGPAQLVVGYQGVAASSSELLALHVLAEVLGSKPVDVFTPGAFGSRASRLGRTLGSAYAFVDAYADAGLVGIYAASESHTGGDLLAAVHKEVRAAVESLTEEEVVRAQKQLQRRFASLSASRQQYAATLHTQRATAAELVAQAASLTRADVQRVAAKALASVPIVAARGNVSGLRL